MAKDVRIGIIGAVVLSLAATACGQSATSSSGQPTATDQPGSEAPASPAASEAALDPAIEELYAAAQEEGTAVFYCSIAEQTCTELAQQFEARYPGIQIASIRLASGDMSARFGAEKTSGAPTADVLMTSDIPFSEDGIADGLLVPWSDDMFPEHFPSDFVMSEIDTPFTYTVNGMAYNADLVDEDKVPTKYEDLLDPYWTGKICNAAPDVSPAVGMLFGTMESYVGDGFLEDLASQDIQFFAGGNVAAIQAVAAGECLLMPFVNKGQVDAIKAEGAPIEQLFLPGVSGVGYPYVLAADSPHPNAQKLFAMWLVSKEGNQALVDLEPATVTPYVTPEDFDPIPPGFEFLSDAEQQRIQGALGLQG
jgi:iron(III) transport system substrate-binding protein